MRTQLLDLQNDCAWGKQLVAKGATLKRAKVVLAHVMTLAWTAGREEQGTMLSSYSPTSIIFEITRTTL